jgi:uncharacterized FAD-dependent dehydrogenase
VRPTRSWSTHGRTSAPTSLPKVITGRCASCSTEVGSQASVSAPASPACCVDGERVVGVRLGDEIRRGRATASEVVLATGHSARDVYERWRRRRHPSSSPRSSRSGCGSSTRRPLVDRDPVRRRSPRRRATRACRPPRTGIAYTPTPPGAGRGVFSFCMCPGGWIVPAATEADGVVVNGMSLSRRDSPFANSGYVVGVEVADVQRAMQTDDVLAGLRFQRQLEAAAASAGGGQLRAPATRVTDFLAGKASADVPASSYEPGLAATNVADVLAATGLPLADHMRAALRVAGGQLRGYVTADAVLVGVESRTSSPVRIPRDATTLEAPGRPGLYPAGEGAGYAGGIVSAALDGIRIARAILAAR